jgi:preprotein translocase subunit SecD
MGMAVDANVLIYERVREELRAGKGINRPSLMVTNEHIRLLSTQT